MNSIDIPLDKSTNHSISSLLRRASQDRVNWTDLSTESGIYIVFTQQPEKVNFTVDCGKAINATPTLPDFLRNYSPNKGNFSQ